jgi:hypothetical protein
MKPEDEMGKSFIKVSDFTTIIIENQGPERVIVSTVYTDAEETIVTAPRIFQSQAAADEKVTRLIKQLSR